MDCTRRMYQSNGSFSATRRPAPLPRRPLMSAPAAPQPPANRPPEREGGGPGTGPPRGSGALITDMENKALSLKEIQPGMRNFCATFIVLEPGSSRLTPQGHEVHTMLVADPTGSMTVTLWSGELNGLIQAGDICRVKNGSGNVHQGTLTLTCGRGSEFSKISEFYLAYSEQPFFSAYRKDLDKRQMSPDVEEMRPGSRSNSASGRPGMKRPGGGAPGGPPNKTRGEFPSGGGRFPR